MNKHNSTTTIVMAIKDAVTSAAVKSLLMTNRNIKNLRIVNADDDTINNLRKLNGAAVATQKYENIGTVVFSSDELTKVGLDKAVKTNRAFTTYTDDRRNETWTIKHFNSIPTAFSKAPVIEKVPTYIAALK